MNLRTLRVLKRAAKSAFQFCFRERCTAAPGISRPTIPPAVVASAFRSSAGANKHELAPDPMHRLHRHGPAKAFPSTVGVAGAFSRWPQTTPSAVHADPPPGGPDGGASRHKKEPFSREFVYMGLISTPGPFLLFLDKVGYISCISCTWCLATYVATTGLEQLLISVRPSSNLRFTPPRQVVWVV